MRVVVASSLLLLLACGGSKKPADAPTETALQETSASPSNDTPSTAEPASAAAPGPAASAGESPEPAPAQSSPSHPVPNVTGSIDGKPFAPKMARINQPMQKDGRIVVTVDERAECGGGEPRSGESVLTMTVPWEDGYKQDLGSLKRAGKKGAGEISLVRVGAAGKKDVSTTFKPSGRVTIVKAAMEPGAVGKMNIDLTSGDYMLAGDLDIQVCVAPKSGSDAASAPSAPKTPSRTAGKKKK